MGYLTELIATEARFRRCSTAWQPHLDQTRAVISDAIAASGGHRKAIVLGAGILSDIPIDALCATFETVQLVDVCFLNRTRRSLRHHGNIDWQTCDITGIAEPLHAWLKRGQHADALPAPSIPGDIAIGDADLIVSANLVSQLPLLPVAWLRKAKTRIEDEAVFRFAQQIVKCHFEMLSSFSGTICLVSEIQRQICDGARILETEDPLWGIAPGIDGREWVWETAPRPEIARNYDVRNRVKGAYWTSARPAIGSA